MDKIIIPLDNGYRLVAERNVGSEFDKEVFIGIETETGSYWQDLCIVRPTYTFKDDEVKFDSDKFEMLIFGDADMEDFTDKFVVPLCKTDDE